MHAHHKQLKELKCASYQYDVGHGVWFRNYLEYRKLTYKIYEKNIARAKD